MAGKPSLAKDGDWLCKDPECNNLNFERRTSCNLCGKEKPSDDVKKDGQEIGKNASEKSKGLFSPDDWQCARCCNVNWARRSTCNMCNGPKFSEHEERSGLGGGYNERGTVEYKAREESDSDDYDDFGRRKKKAIKSSRSDLEPTSSTFDEEEEDDDGDVDLSKYKLDSESEEETLEKTKPELKSSRREEPKKIHHQRSRSRSPRRTSSDSSRHARDSHDQYRNRSPRYRSHRSRSRSKDRRRSRSTSRSKRERSKYSGDRTMSRSRRSPSREKSRSSHHSRR